jgi:hypothetical protein
MFPSILPLYLRSSSQRRVAKQDSGLPHVSLSDEGGTGHSGEPLGMVVICSG